MAQPISDAQFAKTIRNISRDAWLNEEPTPACFDFDVTQDEKLFRFIDETGDAAETEEVRQHLLSCVRCRFLYAVTCDFCRSL